MAEVIDARGLACPQPVILTKKALDAAGEATVLVDNETAVENIRRLASGRGCSADVNPESGGVFRIRVSPAGHVHADTASAGSPAMAAAAHSGPFLIVIASDTMGRGSDELGRLLMKAFLHTAGELDRQPDMLIFYNAGVKLAVAGSDSLDDLKMLEGRGVEILVCGTCANFFQITDKIAAGKISNMYDIAGAMSSAGRIVMP